MPGTAKRDDYARRRALVVAVERRGAADRRRIISALANCLAENRKIPRDWIAALDDGELAEALRLSVRLALRRKWRIGTAVQRLGEACRRFACQIKAFSAGWRRT